MGGALCTTAGEKPATSWNEVPAALFLSWSVPMQLAYCARRDEDTTTHTSCDVLGAEFYTARAAGYKEMYALPRQP